MILGKGQPLRVAIDSRGGAENQRLYLALFHGFEQSDGPDDVIIVIGKRLLYGFAYRFEACKMNHCICVALAERINECGTVPAITSDQRNPFGGYTFHPA